jgi:hypothetical protein
MALRWNRRRNATPPRARRDHVKFEDDLVEEVMSAAPPGVIFEADEVCDALVRAVDALPTFFAFPTAVQRAATLAIRRRKDEAAERTPQVWADAAVDQLLTGVGVPLAEVRYRTVREEWERSRRTVVEVADVQRVETEVAP